MTLSVLFGIIIILLYMWKKNKFISRKEPPIHPGALPIIGHAHLLIGDTKHIWELIKKCSYECMATGNVTYNIAGRKYYMITDPDDCLTISNACLEKDLVYRFAKSCYGDGLVTASQSTWKKHRNLLNPQFNLNYLNGFLVIFNKQSRILVKEFALMAGRGPFDHGSIIRQNEIKTICATSLGVDFNEDKKTLHEYATAFDIIFNCCTEIIKRFWLQIRCIWLRSSLKKQRDKYRIIMHNITDEIIKKRNDDRKNEVLNVNREGKAFRPFLDIFFDLKETVGDEMMPDKTIRDHVNTLILAGHDTIATAVQFTLILIGSYPKVQERLYMELIDIFGDSIRDVEKDDLTRLRYLEAVLKESLRFYTIVPIVARDITKDVDLKNYTLKAGGACLLMLHGVHRLPMWGKDVEEFKPERWLNPATLPKNPNTFLTFSLGKRVCIGKSYAMMSMKTTLAHVLRTYRIKADHTKLELKYECLLKAVSGHFISIERR